MIITEIQYFFSKIIRFQAIFKDTVEFTCALEFKISSQQANLRAKTAIECLEAMRDGTEYKPEIVLPVDLIKRESTRKL